MFGNLVGSSTLSKSLFLLVVGLAGVFSVLILFYILIRVLLKAFPEKGNGQGND
ncbi:MAG TPA: hypothetical protein GXX37_11875 [Clostridiaceae bacterium]|nr:hypothetical protein [Clostridiaceae bacterium]